ncbi:MAG TPA: RodZ domain-containing protein [Steroidobacteraceae bacterium]|jgi:cytoskeleton protein RodZ|nr:RodZ domain-containing protein [Steroidobacteraceae bacterium]
MNESATLPGARLKTERERRGLSAQKAADEMHLDRWVIDALEADDYKRIGPTVYAKGHLKKYAALLGLPPAEILAGYESRPAGPVENISAGPSMLLATRDETPAFGNWSPAQIAGGLIAAVVLAGVLWWRPWHQRTKVPPGTAPVAATSTAPAAVTETAAESGGVSSAGAAPAVDNAPANNGSAAPGATPAIDSGAAAASDAAVPPPGAGRARLRLSFSADSWVDVHDANGRRTFAGNGLANSVKTIAGAAPLRVYLGVGSGVQLEINDRAVAIGPQFFAGDVARFEAGADGVLRRDSHGEPSHTDQAHSAPPRNARQPPG